MEYILFTLERMSPQHLHIIDVTFALILFPVARTQHLLRSDGFHNIFSREMTYMIGTHERWNPQHLFLVDGLHSIFFMREGVHTYTHERWGTQHLLMRDDVHSICS